MSQKHRALFLDRDGVINVDHGWVYTREQFQFVDGIFDLCRSATELGYLIVVVTNQAGIGRGYYTEEHFLELMDWMCGVLRERGAPVAKVYFCPFHPEHGIGAYKVDSIDRKPGPGMILRAAEELEIDLELSVLIGDKPTDIQAGAAARVGCNLLYLPDPAGKQALPVGASASVARLQDAVFFLVRGNPVEEAKYPAGL